jgi:excisionase family DNA binding protein
MTIEKIYTIDEIVDLLKVTRRTVYNYVKNKGLKTMKVGKYLRVHERDLKDFLKNFEK